MMGMPMATSSGMSSGMSSANADTSMVPSSSNWVSAADPSEQRKGRHNLAERRRTNRINKLFNQLYEVLISPEVLPILNEAGPSGQLRKLPRKSKAAVLEAAIHCIETLQRKVAEHEARMRGDAVRA